MEPIVDLYTLPLLKPYGQSFTLNPAGQNISNRNRKNSIWYYDSPNIFEKGIQLFTGICKFTQSDCTTLAYGNTRIVCALLYPIERAFFDNKLGTGKLNDVAVDFISSVGRQRVDFIQAITSYFDVLTNELAFYKQMEGVPVNTEIGKCTYKLANSYQEIAQHIATEVAGETTIFFILSIEGMHVLHSNFNIEGKANEAAVMANLAKLKDWKPRPFVAF